MKKETIVQKIPRGLPMGACENERPVFMAYGAVCFERREGGLYYYRAKNLATGRRIALGHRKTPMPESLFDEVAQRMGQSAAADNWLLADAKDGQRHGKARLADIQRAVFERILPEHGFARREKQAELAGEMLEALLGQKILLAEAEVGIGKTLAYLLPSLLVRRGRANSGKLKTYLPDSKQAPVVIATSSIALQRAIEREYIPALSDILLKEGVIASPITQVLRKGKGNYLCEQRLGHFLNFADARTQAALSPLLSGQSADLASAKGLTPYMKRKICVDDQCGRECKRYTTCRYMRYMQAARRGGYDFQVCNHNYLLADLLKRARGQKPLLPDCQAIVIDEAHKFLDAARQMYGHRVSLEELVHTVCDVQELGFARGVPTADIRRGAAQMLSRGVLLFRFLNREVPVEEFGDDGRERFSAVVRERTGQIIRALWDDAADLAEKLKTRAVQPRFASRHKACVRTLECLAGAFAAFARHPEVVCWLEAGAAIGNAGASDIRLTLLCGIPKKLGAMLREDLWDKNLPVILTSGTLSAAGSFTHVKKKLGLDAVPQRRLAETTKPSPFDYQKNSLLYLSNVVPFPDNDDPQYIRAVADEVERLVRASHGHAAVLFTSYKAMDLVFGRISAKNLPYPLFRLGRGSSGAIEQFKRSKGGVLFASGALWEGIDIPGDALSMLIIVRLPFAVPDPVGEYERTLYENLEEYKRWVVTPEMLVKLKQGYGRLIRTESDTGVVAILDCRALLEAAYHRHVLAALPACRVVYRISDVEQFMLVMKPPEYFEEGHHANAA